MTRAVFVKCGSYQPVPVADAVARLFDMTAPPLLHAERDLRILIKPNLLTDKPPSAAATTHPEVVRAIIRELRARGHNRISVADSSACPMPVEMVWHATGFAAMCQEENVPLLNLEQAGARIFNYKGVSFSIARPVLDANLVINVPKLKTHLLTIITNAVKNMYGAIPGAQKSALHRQFPSPAMLGGLLAHVHDLIRPELTICDAIIAMDGNGPSAGRPKHLGFLAASSCGVALDTAVCKLLRIDPANIPYLAITPESAVEITGEITSMDLPKINLPSTFVGRVIPTRLVHFLKPFLWSRPEFTDSCARCGRCRDICPVSAISIPPSGLPVLKASLCIECGCCNEVCPADAVIIRQSLFLHAINLGRQSMRKILALASCG